MIKTPKLKKWNIPVTEQLDKVVEEVVRRNSHVSKADFVRDAVREKLRKLGLLEAGCNERTY